MWLLHLLSRERGGRNVHVDWGEKRAGRGREDEGGDPPPTACSRKRTLNAIKTPTAGA